MVGCRVRLFFWLILPMCIGGVGFSWAGSPRYTFYDEARLLEVLGPNLLKLKLVKRDKVVVVRLIGVGSPRNRDRVRGLKSEVVSYIDSNRIWESSADFVRSLLSDKVIELWTRRWDRFDEKNRLLAYVMIPTASEGSVDLNGEIIRKGLGFVTRDYVHVTFVHYRELEEEARNNRRGIWGGLSIGTISSLSK
ncbi:MAG: thermonuclease family protein [Desulfomonilaceae bacterium]|nr:thermonuclease family protein [Desulfomonilaceae bacterium]